MHSLITAELNNLNTMSQCIFIQNYLKTQFHFLHVRKRFHVTVFFVFCFFVFFLKKDTWRKISTLSYVTRFQLE